MSSSKIVVEGQMLSVQRDKNTRSTDRDVHGQAFAKESRFEAFANLGDPSHRLEGVLRFFGGNSIGHTSLPNR